MDQDGARAGSTGDTDLVYWGGTAQPLGRDRGPDRWDLVHLVGVSSAIVLGPCGRARHGYLQPDHG